jgi:hypothetical protein
MMLRVMACRVASAAMSAHPVSGAVAPAAAAERLTEMAAEPFAEMPA